MHSIAEYFFFYFKLPFWGLFGDEVMSAGHIKKPIRLLLNVLRPDQIKYKGNFWIVELQGELMFIVYFLLSAQLLI